MVRYLLVTNGKVQELRLPEEVTDCTGCLPHDAMFGKAYSIPLSPYQ